jgi:hypothetical protein
VGNQWEAVVAGLTQRGCHIVCPFCDSRVTSFCECRSVAVDPRLSREWHPSNPPATQVATANNKIYTQESNKCHPPCQARCRHRSTGNTGFPECWALRRGTTHKPSSHPMLSAGRQDLVGEWDPTRNETSPSEVTLGQLQGQLGVQRQPRAPPLAGCGQAAGTARERMPRM